MATEQRTAVREISQTPGVGLPRQRWPLITALACGIAIAVFVGLTIAGDDQSWEGLASWGYLPADRVWAGGYWALVSSAFVHLALWHLGFNVYWLWVLGGPVERRLGALPYLGFILAAAAVSSAVQLGVSGSTGHGASGVVYALFGLIWVSRNHEPALAHGLGRNAPLFWTWLVGCVLVTQLGIASVGNGAHVGGLLFGLLAAQWCVVKGPRHRIALAATGVLVTLAAVPLFWCPWSSAWVAHRAFQAHSAGEYDKAISAYRRVIALGGSRTWALQNLALVYHSKGARNEYETTLEDLREEDTAAAASVETLVKRSEGGPGN
jgi:membrane associated rhomboid family serine protease